MALPLGDEKKKPDSLVLFGGDRGWHEDEWTASDDRVRGGKSQSYLVRDEKNARFYGELDIKTLGGAGFASQRTVTEDKDWDLSGYAGIELDIAKGDKKRYTFILKDSLLNRDPDTGREQATISWEVDFDLPLQTVPGDAKNKVIYIPWSALTPTYRGKPKKDAEPLDLKKIKRFSIMMRSFFGTQEGEFSLTIKSIKAVSHAPPPSYAQVVASDLTKIEHNQPEQDGAERPTNRGFWRYVPFILVAVHLAALATFIHMKRC